MSFKPFKFLHAANLYLNHQLVGTGILSEDAQQIVERATITAFEKVIEEAVTWEVDFVLLTGNSFDETDQSLGSRVELLNGLAFLTEANIPTFVLPGEDDPYDAWLGIAGLPDLITLIDPQSTDFFSVKQHDEMIAQIGTIHSFKDQQPLPGFQVAMTIAEDMDEALQHHRDLEAIEYLAMGGKSRQTAETAACTLHAPGGTQGVTVTDVDEHGCSLVEVTAANDDIGRHQAEINFLPTASVRWESPSVQTARYASLEKLGNQMIEAMRDKRVQSAEKLWILHWNLYNSGSLAALMNEPNTEQLLTQMLHDGLSIPDSLLLQSTYQLLPDPNRINQISQQSQLAESFFDQLVESQEGLPQQLHQLLSLTNLEENSRGEYLTSLIDEINPTAILGHAQQLGLNWFSKLTSTENR